MHGGEGLARLELVSPLRPEDALPEVKLKSLVVVSRPGAQETRIVSLCGERDTQPQDGGPTFELQLHYSFSVAKTTDTMLNIAALSDLLYENELESQMWMVGGVLNE